ncbi:hypothetical protein GKQ23_05930 [Erwinia sp. E602]|uniref:winged helix-turn-helix domain-containing protein n=1 Tax=Erwinia sp. E602 TaxID=2675378 RepID=UPI001BA8589A|nr:winged helix-turn-helix domain-containing protein [Erwinia sp. E602]QUG74573.1 hypothetical protein GKQ23_05930 [Erwinia sp. E602]
MKEIVEKNSKEEIHFLNFSFNRNTRILKKDNKVMSLVKKEADALALLCDRAPNPVTAQEFNSAVWRGRCVTPQSIAQVIRSLRVKLNDTEKNIIITLPKLGYGILTDVVGYESGNSEKAMQEVEYGRRYRESNKDIRGYSSIVSELEIDAALNDIKGLQNLILHKILELEKISKSSGDANLL